MINETMAISSHVFCFSCHSERRDESHPQYFPDPLSCPGPALSSAREDRRRPFALLSESAKCPLLFRRDPLLDRLHHAVAAGLMNLEQHALLLVVADERCGLLIVHVEALADSLHGLVGALDRGAAALFTLVAGGRRVALDV